MQLLLQSILKQQHSISTDSLQLIFAGHLWTPHGCLQSPTAFSGCAAANCGQALPDGLASLCASHRGLLRPHRDIVGVCSMLQLCLCIEQHVPAVH